MRRFLAYRPDEIQRVYRLLDLVAAGRPWTWSGSLAYLFCFSVGVFLGFV